MMLQNSKPRYSLFLKKESGRKQKYIMELGKK
jgi:hypothetical protein